MTAPERAAEVLAAILRELERPHGPTECHQVIVLNSWASGDEIFVVYVAPWFPGQIGYRHALANEQNPYLAEDIAHFDIAEPLGRLVEVMGPPDADGITWWDDTTLQRLDEATRKPRFGWLRPRRR